MISEGPNCDADYEIMKSWLEVPDQPSQYQETLKKASANRAQLMRNPMG